MCRKSLFKCSKNSMIFFKNGMAIELVTIFCYSDSDSETKTSDTIFFYFQFSRNSLLFTPLLNFKSFTKKIKSSKKIKKRWKPINNLKDHIKCAQNILP